MAYTLYKNLTTVNRTVMNGKKNLYIVLHYTGNKTDTAKNNAAYFKSVNRGASAHYFVDKTSVYQVVEDKDAAWSVGKNYGTKNLFQTVKNKNSINIEMCSDNGAIAEETFQNAAELTKLLMKKYKIPASRVYRHFDVCSKQCPGWKGWTGSDESLWKKFKAALAPAARSSRYQVRLLDDLNVRQTPNGKILQKNGAKKGFIYTIVETSGTWGRLKSGAGWISVAGKYVQKISP